MVTNHILTLFNNWACLPYKHEASLSSPSLQDLFQPIFQSNPTRNLGNGTEIDALPSRCRKELLLLLPQTNTAHGQLGTQKKMIYSAPKCPPQAAAGVPQAPPAPALPPGTAQDRWWSLPEHSPKGFTRRLAAFVSISKYVIKFYWVTSWPAFSIPLLAQCLNLLFHDLGLKRGGEERCQAAATPDKEKMRNLCRNRESFLEEAMIFFNQHSDVLQSRQ